MSAEIHDLVRSSKEVDFYRDTPVRLLGYTNEVGEAFRPLVNKKIVWLSYAIASTYVLADVVDKTIKAYKTHSQDPNQNAVKTMVAKQSIDALTWQSFASVIVPGVVINRTCFVSLYLLSKVKGMPKPVRRWTTTAIGLVSIPFIIKPIDNFVDYVMDESIRKYL